MAMAASLGCPFTPRDSPPPCTPGVDPGCRTPRPFRDPLSPEILRDNIVNAVLKRGFDDPPTLEPHYDLSLNPAFTYIPDPLSEAQAPTCGGGAPFFENWTHDREVQFMHLALDQVGTSALPDSAAIAFPVYTLDTGSGITGPDRKRYDVEYVMTLKYPPQGQGGERQTVCYAGRAKWDLIGGDLNYWTLLQWLDLEGVPGVSCPGGSYGGTLGDLRRLVGQCP